ncbi:MAG: DUF4276 family protein, partial [Burkholderiaceae bacterium]
ITLEQKLHTLTAALHEDIVKQAGCRSERFIPHIQPHEFEALLFSDVDALVATETHWAEAREALKAVRAASETPEHINNRPETKPSAQLQRLLRMPSFSKTRHGPLAAQRMGLARIESSCPCFAHWLEQLRRLGSFP